MTNSFSFSEGLSKIKGFYLREDGGKKTVNITRFFYSVGFTFFIIVTLLTISSSLNKKNDTSTLKKSSIMIKGESKGHEKDTARKVVGGVKNKIETENLKSKRLKPASKPTINYRAKQVISANNMNSVRTLPLGMNLIAKLLTSVDTRGVSQEIKAILPFGGKHERSGGSLPPNTILFGNPSYSGKGSKVFINFTKGLLPSGEEIRLNAQALDSKDYSVGLTGEFHGNAKGRTAAVLGLTMVSTMTDTLVKREALGQGFNVTPKASLHNSFYNGLSKVANVETNRQAQKLNQIQEYVTVDAGSDFIVSLTSSFKEKESNK